MAIRSTITLELVVDARRTSRRCTARSAPISLIGSQSSNVTTFPVVIDVTGNPSGLYAGATAEDVSIIVKQLNNVTEVPTQAISYGYERPGVRDGGCQRRARRQGRHCWCGGER